MGEHVGWLKTSFGTRGGRIEWLGVILATPFAIASVYLWAVMVVYIPSDAGRLQVMRYAAGGFFASGMALGIYATAWSFAAEELYHRLVAYAAILYSAAFIAASVVLEWLVFIPVSRAESYRPFMIPAFLALLGTFLFLPAIKARRLAKGADEGAVPSDE